MPPTIDISTPGRYRAVCDEHPHYWAPSYSVEAYAVADARQHEAAESHWISDDSGVGLVDSSMAFWDE